MTASAAIVAVNAAVNKEGVAIFSSVLLLAALSNAGGGLLSLGFNKLRSRGQAGSNLHLSFDPGLLKLSAICGFVQLASFSTFLYAFAYGGPLAIVYTIHSLYILIPIVLSILFYNEHWSFRKVAAIIVSIAAIGLMG